MMEGRDMQGFEKNAREMFERAYEGGYDLVDGKYLLQSMLAEVDKKIAGRDTDVQDNQA